MNKKKKIIIAVTGASGAVYADMLIKKLYIISEQIGDCCIIFSDNAKLVWEYELQRKDYKNLPFGFYENNDFFAPFASGSSNYDAMIICPCSMGTLGRIASGISDNLITRTADVILKERKKLVLVTRETPLNLIHINNMKVITETGGIICPASPSLYSHPKNLEELFNTVIEKVLILSGFEIEGYKWGKV